MAEVKYYSEVVPKDVEWLWYPYIPYGKITLLQGDPGDGKSTFAIHLASILTRGASFPDGYSVTIPQTVIYQCAEDGMEDTIKPRLIEAGADCNRVAFIVEESQEEGLSVEDARLEEAIIKTGARFLILDPIQSFIPTDTDMQSAQKMRALLSHLTEIASRYQCAILMIGHMTKASGGKNLYRGLGSIDIAAIARSVLMITRDQEQAEVRYMFPVKSSLAPEGKAIAFILDKESGFHWLGPCSRNKEEILERHGENSTKKGRAKELIRIMLSAGEVPSADVYARLKELDIGERTVRTAGQELKVKAVKRGSAWYWRLEMEKDQTEDGKE